MTSTRLAVIDTGQVNERILNKDEYRAVFRKVEGASLKRTTHLSSPHAKRMFARCFYSFQASMYFISQLGRAKLDHEVVERIDVVSQEAAIHRRNRERTITVLAGAGPGLNADQAFRAVRADIEAMNLPAGYRMEWGGEFEASSDAQAMLGAQLPLGFLVMVAISVLLFNKVRQPLILWLVVPMSVTGMVLGLLVSGLPFTFTALLGLLSLSGMLIKNGIVLVEEIDLTRHPGIGFTDAVVNASVSRMRPVLLAAVTTILGMVPLLWDAFFVSMAVTIMGGLAFATVLTLVAAPVFYHLLLKPRRRAAPKPAAKAAAPA